MNRYKIFKYELKRLLINKVFAVLLVITAFYSWQVLDREIVMGVAYTAPFSQWSYGAFLGNILPLLSITLLFFVTYLFSQKEKMVGTITSATPADPVKYGLTKWAAVLVGYVLIAVVVIGISMVFYSRTFEFWDFGSFVVPLALTLIPSLLLTFGLGTTLGRINPNLLYVLMMLILLSGRIGLPYGLDVFSGTFFSEYPLTLPIGELGEPAFVVPASVMLGRTFVSLIGISLIVKSVLDFRRQSAV